MPTWSYISSYDHDVLFLGTYHSTDMSRVLNGQPTDSATKTARTYYFNFLCNLDPNKGTATNLQWSLWDDAEKVLWFESGSKNALLDDNLQQRRELDAR